MSGGDPRTWVFALTVFRGELIAGGVFTHADGRLVNGVARWDGQTWQPLGAGILSREDVWVFALASYDDRLIVGGAFTHAGGARVNYIAAWDGSGWSDLGGGTDSWVRSLCVFDSQLYVGGHFGLAGGQPAPRIGRWSSGPVPAGLVEFAALRLDAWRARVRFRTSAAAEATAFHVYRTLAPDPVSVSGTLWTRITPTPLPAAPDQLLTVDDPTAPAAPAAYWLEELRAGGSIWHGPALLAPSGGEQPTAIALGPAAPNPFGQVTRFDFALPRATAVELRVLDLRGRVVAQLLDAGLAPGEHSVAWDGRDGSGGRAAQGIYLVRLRAGGHESVRRVTLSGR
jgi:hypothetical protein